MTIELVYLNKFIILKTRNINRNKRIITLSENERGNEPC